MKNADGKKPLTGKHSTPKKSVKRNPKSEYYTKYLQTIKADEATGDAEPADSKGKDEEWFSEDTPPIKKKTQRKTATAPEAVPATESAPCIEDEPEPIDPNPATDKNTNLHCACETAEINKLLRRITPTINFLSLLRQKLVSFRDCADYAPCHVPAEVKEATPCDLTFLMLVSILVSGYEEETAKTMKNNLDFYVKHGLFTADELNKAGIPFPTGNPDSH